MSIERRLPLLLLVTLLALLPAMSACDSNEPGIEPGVEALIDGAPFVAAQTNSSWFDFACLSGATTVRGTIIYGAAPIGEGAAVGEERLFLFTTRPIDGPGAYDIVTLDYEGRCGGVSYYRIAGIDRDDPFGERSVYHALSGRVTVDDADGGVLSGTFEMEAENGEGTALSVRDGRFTGLRGAEN